MKHISRICLCRCDRQVELCHTNPCENGGICNIRSTDVGSRRGVEIQVCTCATGYYGELCQHWSPCHESLNPCRFGGTCRLTPGNNYICECPRVRSFTLPHPIPKSLIQINLNQTQLILIRFCRERKGKCVKWTVGQTVPFILASTAVPVNKPQPATLASAPNTGMDGIVKCPDPT